MLRYCRHLFLPLGLCLAPAGLAFGQSATPLDEERLDQEQPNADAQPGDEEKAPVEALTSVEVTGEAAVTIRTIRFVGSDVPAIVGEAVQGFVGTPTTRANLQALSDAMSAAYRKSDVALFTIVIPEQEFTKGEVRVFVAEGFIQSVALGGEVDASSLALVRSYAAKLIDGHTTSRRKLERYLSLIRGIPGLEVKSRLERGKGRGAVHLVLELDQEKPRILTSYDSRSTRLIDQGQFQAKARLYGLLRSGDLTEVTGTSSVNFKDLLYFGLTHSTPIGGEGARLALSAGHLETQPSETPVLGNAETFGVTLTYPIIRTYKQNLTASLAIGGVNSDNTAFGSILVSEQTRAARAALGYSHTNRKTALTAGITASQGLNILGAHVDETRGKTDYFKLNGQAGLTQSIGKAALLKLKSRAQWTKDALPANERFSVGGSEFGRSFENGLLSTDRGVSTMGELSFRPLRSGSFSRSEVYAFADYSYVSMLSRPGYSRHDFDLASAGGGIRAAWRDKAMIGIEAARTIDKPVEGYNSQWLISVNWRLAFKS